jgi:integrase
MNVNYYLKDKTKPQTAINCIIRYRGQRYKLATGESVNPEFWDGRRATLRKAYPEAATINIKLDRFETRITKAFEPHIINRTIPTISELRENSSEFRVQSSKANTLNSELKTMNFTAYFQSYNATAPIAASTLKKYKTTLRWIKQYEQRQNRRLTFDDVNVQFYTHFREWIINKTYLPRADALPQRYSANYFGSLVKCIKRVMNEASAAGLHTNTAHNSPRFKPEAETADAIYLTMDELMKIHRLNPTPEQVAQLTRGTKEINLQRKTESLMLVKNKFLIGCFTALRVSDFNRLDEVNIKQNWIRIKPRKGTRKNADVVIPIHPVVREIINSGFNIATPISDQKINEHIKEVCKLAGITEKVSTTRTEGGRQVERTAPKWAKVCTHTARRSGATNMFIAGIPSISIMLITGHTTEKSFLKYIKITAEQNARLLQEHPFFK